MRYAYEPDVEAFRTEVRQFIAENLPPEEVRLQRGYEGGFKTNQEEYDYTMGFQKKLSAKGWLAMAWPKEYGGGGASHMRQLVYNEEMAYHGAPAGNMGIAWVGPSLMLYGTDEQKARFIPRITGADDWWCTLYSEPGAGSDLASLQTRATRDGDDFILNGQKIWTSAAHSSDAIFALVRTDPEAPKHRGISFLLIDDIKAPGISVRPLIDMGGRHYFNEVFFEDVRVPAANLVGEMNRGWYAAMTLLDFERSNIGGAVGARRTLARLIEVIQGDPALSARVASSPIRHEIAQRYIETEVMYQFSLRIISMQNRGQIPNDEASMAKLYNSELSQRLAQTCMQVLGLQGNLMDGTEEASFARLYIGMVPATIRGGTSEVQRNVIATRGLGLPRA